MSKGYLFLALALIAGISQAEQTDLKLTGQQGVHYFFTVSSPWANDPKYIKNVLMNFCYDKEICITHIWNKKDANPKKLPFSDKEVELELATFQHNKNTGRNELLWNCKKFPGEKLTNCF